MEITKGEHRKVHEDLHKSLDQLVADFLTHNRTKLPTDTTVMELMEWSHLQTKNPTPIGPHKPSKGN